MEQALREVLNRIGEKYINDISRHSRIYLEANIGKEAEKMGYSEIRLRYGSSHAIVPLKQPVPGMKVLVDGRTFVNYAQLKSGIVVPVYIADTAGLDYSVYVANDSMVLNFAA